MYYAEFQQTLVSGPRTKENRLSTSMRATLTSSRANFIPMQLRGPTPNGMCTLFGRLVLSSAENLHIQATLFSHHSIQWGNSPVRIKLLWVIPILGIIVELLSGNENPCSFRNTDSTNGSCLNTQTGNTTVDIVNTLLIQASVTRNLHHSWRVETESLLNSAV